MANFVRAANPIWWIPDLTGFPLNDEYYAFFLTNDLPYVFQPVFQDPDGMIPWAAPLQFQPAGTLPNNLYFDDSEVYRIEIRHGNSSNDQLIYLIENFVPGTGGAPSSTDILSADNMITNPQFADVYFNTPPGGTNPTMTYAQASPGNYSFDVGPGWRIDLVGSGSITLTQVPIAGNSNTPGDATYALHIGPSSGWTSIKLIQRFANNGAIFGGGAIALAFTANATGSSPVVTVLYQPSFTTGIPTEIFAGPIATSAFEEYKNAVDLPASTNTDLDGLAFVDIVFNIPVGSDLFFTNIQIVGQSVPLPGGFDPDSQAPSYQQETYQRTVDHEFNVYKPWLFQKRIPSKLVGWDFPLNPAQFIGASVPVQPAGANSSFYAWDQTIVFQSVSSGVTISSPNAGSFMMTAAVNTQLAIIQYLDTFETRELLSDAIALNIAAISTTASMTGIPCTVSLWYTTDASLPSTKIAKSTGLAPTSTSFVGGLDANGKPNAFNLPGGIGSWKEVPRNNLQDARFTVKSSPNANFNDYNFMGWDLNGIADVNNATFFAIVIGTAQVTAADSIQFQSVGLMNGHIATRPAPQTDDEVLRECRYFYEKTYELGVEFGSSNFQGQVTIVSPLIFPGANVELNTRSIAFNFKVTKRTVDYTSSPPKFALNFCTGSGAAGLAQIYIHDTSNNNVDAIDTAGISTNPAVSAWLFTAPPPGNAGGWITTDSVYGTGFRDSGTLGPVPRTNTKEGVTAFHYEADCRLGL